MTLSLDSLLLILGATLRIGSFMAIAPPFSSAMIPVSIRVGMSLSMGVAGAHLLPFSNTTFNSSSSMIGFFVVQVIFGLALGLVVNTLISAFSSAGYLSGLLGGFSPPPQMDPLNLNQNSGLGILYEIISLELLFSSGGYLLILKGLFVSLSVGMPHGISVAQITSIALANFTTFFGAVIQITAPVAAVMFTIQVLLSILSRVSPSISVYALSFPIQILATIFVVTMVISDLPGFTSLVVNQTITTMMALTRALNGA